MKLPLKQIYKGIKHRLSTASIGSKTAIYLIIIVASWVNFNNSIWNKPNGVVHNDIISYYSYLPALFIHNDLSFSYVDDDPKFFAGKFYDYFTEDGSRYQKMTLGLSVLYSPFFMLGHLTAWLSHAEMNGYSTPYMFFLAFSSLAYLVLGLFILRRLLLRYFGDGVVALVLLLIVMGTNLFYYATLQAAMPHVYNFSLFALFIWLTIRWHEKPNWLNSIWIGLVIGLIGLIRPTNGIVILFFLFFNVYSINSFKNKLKLLLKNPLQLLLMVLLGFLVVVPQLLFWKSNTGQWVYYSYDQEGFFFNNPQILSGLFSYRKGWLLYTPLMIFALIGIAYLPKWRKCFFLPILVFTVANIYIVYSWWSWWYGGSFGSRPMIDSYALLAIPLAVFIQHFSSKSLLIKRLLYAFLLLLMMFNIYQTLQYKYGIIHHDEMSKAAYWHILGKKSADLDLYDKLEPIDIKLAMQGIYQTKLKIKPSIRHKAFTSFEELTQDSTHFLSDDGHFHFRRGKSQYFEIVRSGQASMQLDKEYAFGATIDFYVYPNEEYQVEVWKYPAGSRASLVMAATTAEEFYRTQEIPDSISADGWGRLRFTAKIPNVIDGKYRLYIWNKAGEDVYIDDLLIERIK